MQLVVHNGKTADSWYKDRLNALIEEVFGFSFQQWHSLGVWNDDYECFSLIDKDSVVANISAFKMDLKIDGANTMAVQLGAVSVKPVYRGRGLARRLMDHVMTTYQEKPMFLFCGENVREFYPRFGFRTEPDKQPFRANPPIEDLHSEPCQAAAMPLKTRRLIDGYLRNRRVFSRKLDCKNPYSVNWFHVLYGHSQDVYELPDLGALVIASFDEDTLCIHDVAAESPVNWNELSVLGRLPFDCSSVQQIRFGFNPDWLGVAYEMVDHAVEDSTLFVWNGMKDLPGMIPQLIRT